MSQENVEVVRRIYVAFERGDSAEMLRATHPAITCHDRPGHPVAKVFHGRAGLLALIEDDRQTVGGMRWEPLHFTEIGHRVLVRVRQSGRGQSSGVPVEGEVVMVWTIDGGAARALHIYSTEAEALEAVGLSE